MYQCERCGETSETGVPTLIQHYESFEELRCANCYRPEAEKVFNDRKSLTQLRENLTQLTEALNEEGDRTQDRYKIENKIEKTQRNILKVKKRLGLWKRFINVPIAPIVAIKDKEY